jgi:predicted N-acetyltransferase YhbS
MDIKIRIEKPEDIQTIFRINELAFKRDEEAQLVDDLRDNDAALLSRYCGG